MLLAVVLALYVGPAYGHRHVVVYVLLCSSVGSVTVLGCKGLGLAIKESIMGESGELVNWLTFTLLVIVVVCIMVCILNRLFNVFMKILNLLIRCCMMLLIITYCLVAGADELSQPCIGFIQHGHSNTCILCTIHNFRSGGVRSSFQRVAKHVSNWLYWQRLWIPHSHYFNSFAEYI